MRVRWHPGRAESDAEGQAVLAPIERRELIDEDRAERPATGGPEPPGRDLLVGKDWRIWCCPTPSSPAG